MPNLKLYNTNGTLNGAYVYTLICQDNDGPLYIKLGMSINPLKRFNQLRGGNPIQPRTLAWINLASKDTARMVEIDLQCACEEWHHSLEWFVVRISEFPDFREACKVALEKHQSPSRPPIKWAHIDAQALIKDGHNRRAKFFKIYKARGAAYAQFMADGGGSKGTI